MRLADLAQTPREYAGLIARYISDPSTIRTRTMDQFGRAPSLEDCKGLRQAALDRIERFRIDCEARSTDLKKPVMLDTFECGHERSMENTWLKGNRERCFKCYRDKRTAIAKSLNILNLVADQPDAPTERFEDAISSSHAPSKRVLLLAARLFNMPVELILSRSRKKPIVQARWAVMLALRKTLGWSLPQTGQFVSISDHTSVRYAIQQAEALIERDAKFAEACQRLCDIAVIERPKVSGDILELLAKVAA